MILAFQVAFGVILSVCALQDYKTTYADGILCSILWLILCVYTALAEVNFLRCGLLIALMILYFIPYEIPFFGDADIIPFAGCALLLFPQEFDYSPEKTARALVPMFALLAIMYPWARFYYAFKYNKDYKLFQGMQVPMLPAFAAAWWMSVIGLLIIDGGII